MIQVTSLYGRCKRSNDRFTCGISPAASPVASTTLALREGEEDP